MSLIANKYASRLTDGALIVRDCLEKDKAIRHLFPVEQLWLFVRLDTRLRKATFKKNMHAVPGGYEIFVALWNLDETCEFLFCEYDAALGKVTTHGTQVIPPDLFVPPKVETPATKVIERVVEKVVETSKYTPEQEKIIDAMIWDAAFREISFRAKKTEFRRGTDEMKKTHSFEPTGAGAREPDAKKRKVEAAPVAGPSTLPEPPSEVGRGPVDEDEDMVALE
ncbi:predicted protein [Postia placenta Mad-698-R]|nr:predicted protein [Postia placenta Mad-698-R]